MFLIKVAGMVIGIKETFPYIREVCRQYQTEDGQLPLFTVEAFPKELECMKHSVTWKSISSAEAESLVVMKKIANTIPQYQAILFHAAVVQCRNLTVAFSAKRGTGKTTHAQLWLDVFGDEAKIINGDKPLLRVEESIVTAYGTPWSGKECMQMNAGMALNAICFLERGASPRVRQLDHEEYTRRFLEQTNLPNDEEGINQGAKVISQVIRTIPAFVLEANISKEAVLTAYSEISQKIFCK